MLTKLIQFSLRYRWVMLFLYGIIVVLGIYMLWRIPVDVLPNLTNPRVTVFAEAPWLWSEEVESIITWPLERAFANIKWVTTIRGSSALGIAVINIEFSSDTVVNVNRQYVSERMSSITLPPNIHLSIAPESALLGEILWIGLTSESGSLSQSELRWIAEGTVRKSLSGIKGISNLLIMGGAQKQFTIELDPAKMIAQNITLDILKEKITDITFPAGWGFLIDSSKEYPISLTPVTPDVEVLGNLSLIRNDVWSQVQLTDIASVTTGTNSQRRWDALIDGEAGIIVRISKSPDANTIELTQAIEERLDDLESSLPKGVVLHRELFRQANFIELWLENVEKALLDAIIIVAIIVALFLMNIRTTLVTIISLPITLLITAIIFKQFGIGINIMTLGGITIAIGELVDDAIVDMENIFRRLKENYMKPKDYQSSWFDVIFHASQEVRGSVIYATLLQLIVFVPFLMLPWLDGKLFAPIAEGYIISLFASLFVAITFVPAISSYIFPRFLGNYYQKKYWTLINDTNISPKEKEDKIQHILEEEENTKLTKFIKKYAKILIVWSLAKPKRALILAIISLPMTIVLYSLTEKEWLPPFNETSYTVGIVTKPWSSLEYTLDIVQKFTRELEGIEGILSAWSIIWRADADAHAQWSNNAEVEIELGIEVSNADKIRIKKEIQKIIEKYKTVAVFSIGQPITHRVEEIVSGIRAPLVIKVYGTDLDTIEWLAREVLAITEKVDWVVNPSLEAQTKVPSIKIEPKITNQNLYNIPYNTIRESIALWVWGEQVGEVIDGVLRYPVILMYDKNWKDSLQSLGSIPLLSDENKLVTLGNVAKITETKTRNMINHENGERRIVLQWFTNGRGIVDVVEDIKSQVNNKIVIPEGYRISYEGLYQAQKESSKLLFTIGIFVIIAIGCILYFHFRDLSLVFQVLLWVFTGWFGGVIGVWISGGILSTAHLIGFIALMGIVARNGIMLIDRYKNIAHEEHSVVTKEIIMRGSLDRVLPVAMTALSAILWLLPLVLGSTDTGKEMISPIAIVIFWWLLVSTLIELLIRPWVYYLFSHKKKTSLDERGLLSP